MTRPAPTRPAAVAISRAAPVIRATGDHDEDPRRSLVRVGIARAASRDVGGLREPRPRADQLVGEADVDDAHEAGVLAPGISTAPSLGAAERHGERRPDRLALDGARAPCTPRGCRPRRRARGSR